MRTHLYQHIARTVTRPKPFHERHVAPVEKRIIAEKQPEIERFSPDLVSFPTIRAILYRPPASPPYNMPPRRPGAKDIIREVAELSGFTVEQIKGESRYRALVLVRQHAMWRIRMELNWSLPMIGRHFGRRDHTTVLHAVRKIESMHRAGTLQDTLDKLYGGQG